MLMDMGLSCLSPHSEALCDSQKAEAEDFMDNISYTAAKMMMMEIFSLLTATPCGILSKRLPQSLTTGFGVLGSSYSGHFVNPILIDLTHLNAKFEGLSDNTIGEWGTLLFCNWVHNKGAGVEIKLYLLWRSNICKMRVYHLPFSLC